MRIILLGVVVFLIGLAGWFTIPGLVVSSLNLPVVQGQVPADEAPAWLTPLVIIFELLVVAGAAMVLAGLVRRFRPKPS